MDLRRVCPLLSVLALGASGSLAGQVVIGPTSTYYLTDGDSRQLVIVSGAGYTVKNYASGAQSEYPVAVNGSIYTAGGRSFDQPGSVYDLAGNFLRAGGAWTLGTTDSFWDGTTDGTFNYAYNFGQGGVYRFNSDWSGGTLLFAFGNASEYLGITYDPTDNTLWVSGWSNNTVVNLSMTGTILGSFTATNFTNSLTSLALDHADGTLWMGSQNSQGVFAQYTKTGTLLGTVNFGFSSNNTLGGEFNFQIVPEPSAFALLGAGLLLLIATRRRQASDRGDPIRPGRRDSSPAGRA
jgi:hypothetical protein